MRHLRKMQAVLLAGMLLTACGSDAAASSAGSAASSAAESAAEPAESSKTETQPVSESSSEQTESAPEKTDAPKNEQTTVTVQTTAESSAQPTEPAFTEYPGPPADAFDCRTKFKSSSYAAPLTGTGTVFARSGLNLREKPSASAKKIKTLPFGTALTVSALTVNGTLHDRGTRWIKVKADGKEGWVSADYAAVLCTKPADKMTQEEKAALGILMYYQSKNLTNLFLYEGGISATDIDSRTLKIDGELWQKLSPKGLTVQSILDDYEKYFSMEFPYTVTEIYCEHDGWLYTWLPDTENLYLQYDELVSLTSESADKLSYDAEGHWNTEGEFVMYPENGGISHEPFVLEYIDGVWKTAQYSNL